jgi:hypothetical protein
MTPTPAAVAAIADGLSKAQREAICHPSHGPFSTSIYSLTSASTRAALQRKGVVVDRMYATALTPLGLAVKRHLEGTTDHA